MNAKGWLKDVKNRWKEIYMIRKVDKVIRESKRFDGNRGTL